MIGRNNNFRFDDLSSIWSTNTPEEYFTRLSSPDRDLVYESNFNLLKF